MEKAVLLNEPEKYDYTKFDRVYLGNEFCQNLLPTLSIFKGRIESVIRHKKEISFVTPYVTYSGLSKLIKLFDYLDEQFDKPEIIVNDFGVLNLINKEYPSFKIALGRVISNNLMKNSMEMRVNCGRSLRLFNSMNVERLEISNKGKEMKVILDPDYLGKIKVSLYYPFLYLTTGRRCMHGFSHFTAKEGFIPDKCGIKCGKAYHIIKNKGIEKDILMIGNCHFITEDELPAQENLLGVDRLVYMPKKFFTT